MNKKIIVLGGGGHAKVLIDTLITLGQKPYAIVDKRLPPNTAYLDIPIINSDEKVKEFSPNEILLVNGIGSVGINPNRTNLFNSFSSLGYIFMNIIHPSAIVSRNVTFEQGACIMANSVLQPGVSIGNNVIVNTSVSVDHDSIIEDHVHLAPGANLCGNVVIKNSSHIGTGAIIIQGIEVGASSLVGAGVIIVKNLPDNVKVIPKKSQYFYQEIKNEY